MVAYAKAHCVLRDLTPEERTRFGLPPAPQPPEPLGLGRQPPHSHGNLAGLVPGMISCPSLQ
ncbi:MAG: hypothetical protein ACP5HG_10575 [Anaerolineae bacterium]